MRKGFTLVEMLIALVIVGVVSQAIYKLLITQQRLTVTQVEQAVLQSNVRLGTLVLATELRELGSDTGGTVDLVTAGPSSVTYRAMRSLGFACEATSTQVKLRATPLYGIRLPVAGQDSLMLLIEKDPAVSKDDRWGAFPITSVAQGASCGGVPAIALGTSLDSASRADLLLEAPARTYEIMEIGEVAQDGLNWLGARSVSGGQAMQPVAGPLAAGGLTFAYYDSLGAVTATRSRIRSIRISMRGRSDLAVRVAGTSPNVQPVQDSLVRWVTLRNSPIP